MLNDACILLSSLLFFKSMLNKKRFTYQLINLGQECFLTVINVINITSIKYASMKQAGQTKFYWDIYDTALRNAWDKNPKYFR